MEILTETSQKVFPCDIAKDDALDIRLIGSKIVLSECDSKGNPRVMYSEYVGDIVLDDQGTAFGKETAIELVNYLQELITKL